VPPGSTGAGKTLQDLNLRQRHGIQVLAIKRMGKYLANPTPVEPIQDGDVLVMVGPPGGLTKLAAEIKGA